MPPSFRWSLSVISIVQSSYAEYVVFLHRLWLFGLEFSNSTWFSNPFSCQAPVQPFRTLHLEPIMNLPYVQWYCSTWNADSYHSSAGSEYTIRLAVCTRKRPLIQSHDGLPNFHINTYMHTYIHTYVHTYTYIHSHTYMHACIHTCIYVILQTITATALHRILAWDKGTFQNKGLLTLTANIHSEICWIKFFKWLHSHWVKYSWKSVSLQCRLWWSQIVQFFAWICHVVTSIKTLLFYCCFCLLQVPPNLKSDKGFL